MRGAVTEALAAMPAAVDVCLLFVARGARGRWAAGCSRPASCRAALPTLHRTVVVCTFEAHHSITDCSFPRLPARRARGADPLAGLVPLCQELLPPGEPPAGDSACWRCPANTPDPLRCRGVHAFPEALPPRDAPGHAGTLVVGCCGRGLFGVQGGAPVELDPSEAGRRGASGAPAGQKQGQGGARMSFECGHQRAQRCRGLHRLGQLAMHLGGPRTHALRAPPAVELPALKPHPCRPGPPAGPRVPNPCCSAAVPAP